MRAVAVSAVALLVLAGCAGGSPTAERSTTPSTTIAPSTSAPTSTVPPSTTVRSSTTVPADPRPDWLGKRILPIRPDGLGEIQPTPPELVDRRFPTVDLLPPPSTDDFRPTVEAPTDEILARSTWGPACPVAAPDLRYVTVPFWGFDEVLHTGELLVHADAVDTMVAGFEALHARRFPIEEMRITRAEELDLAPTGDGNNTTSFVCRPAVGSTSWSQHAYGRAVDVNPFHNPYVRGDVVLPELASAYVERPDLPGVLTADDVAAFTAAGWGWGGNWRSSKDHMHLSANGR